MTDDEIRELLNIEAAGRRARTVNDEAYQRLLSHARHTLRPLAEEVLRLRAEHDTEVADAIERCAEYADRYFPDGGMGDAIRCVIGGRTEFPDRPPYPSEKELIDAAVQHERERAAGVADEFARDREQWPTSMNDVAAAVARTIANTIRRGE